MITALALGRLLWAAPHKEATDVSVTRLTGILIAALVLLAAGGLGMLWRRRNGAFRPAGAAFRPAGVGTGAAEAGEPAESQSETQLLAGLGVRPGEIALLQFSSAFCAPCRATREVCAGVASDMSGVRHIEIDAESRLDAARALNVWRTPTVFVIGPDGHVLARSSGQPTRAQVVAAVTRAVAHNAA